MSKVTTRSKTRRAAASAGVPPRLSMLPVRRAVRMSLLLATVAMAGCFAAAHSGSARAAEVPPPAEFPAAQAQDAKGYLDGGIDKAKRGNLDGALADLNEAIRLSTPDLPSHTTIVE